MNFLNFILIEFDWEDIKINFYYHIEIEPKVDEIISNLKSNLCKGKDVVQRFFIF